MKKRRLWGVLLILVVVLIGAWITKAAIKQGHDQPIAFVNQEAISQKEFAFFLDQQKASVHDYFKQIFGAGDSPTFWSDSFGGEVPMNKAKQQAMDQLVKVKVQQIEAKKYGILDDASYDAFLSGLTKENERRSAAIAKGEIIYGPTQYTEHMYYGYVLSNLAIKLKNTLAEKSWKITESELQSYYDQIKNKYFRNPEPMTIQRLGILFADDQGNIDEGEKKTALSRLQQLVAELESGKTLNEEIARLKQETYLRIDTDEQELGKFDRADYQANGPIRRTADMLEKEQTSEIFEFHGGFYIIKLLEREDHGLKDFESVKDDVTEKYIDKKYDETVNEWVREAEVKIDQKVYDSFKIQ
ncbi:peptidyl-prolyl cis-trans isomerase [Cohnella sp.]|uniref:peptidyl-prolyl cis-trans isomerase n=1 Tax=Cohnella sp. TaxID=1883426 RepID=UPI0035690ABE